MHTIKIFFTVLLIFTVQNIQAQFPIFNWAVNSVPGSVANTNSRIVSATTVDAQGNNYTVGYFLIDISFGNINLASTATSLYQGYIVKTSSTGNFIWAKKLQSNQENFITKIICDNNGSLFITGRFKVNLTFVTSNGTQTLNSLGSDDIFLAKMDTAGNYIWAKRFGANLVDRANALAFDNNGNIYLGGEFEQTVDFDPAAATANLTSNGSTDCFIAKYTSNGDYVWAKSFGNISSVTFSDLTCRNNVLALTGTFTGTMDMDPSAAIDTLSNLNKSSSFIAKFDTAGNYTWARMIRGTNFSGSNLVQGFKVELNTVGEVIVLGDFSGTIDLDPSPANLLSISNAVARDAYLLKLDAAGNYVWGFTLGQNFNCVGNDVVLDANDDIYLTGGFSGTVDFDPSAATSALTGTLNNSNDIFIVKYTNAGALVAVRMIGTSSGIDEGSSMAIDASGAVYTCGRFNGIVNFNSDVSGTPFNLNSNGKENIFIHKMNSASVSSIKFKDAEELSVNVYPVPAKTKLQAQVSNANVLDYSIINVLGVLQKASILDQSSQSLDIDISLLSKGVYILNLNTSKGKVQRKFSIME